MSVRLRELPGFADAIVGCLELMEAQQRQRQENQANRPAAPMPGRRTEPANEPDKFDDKFDDGFDEFATE